MSAELIQGSAEWHVARCGSLGASQVADALARTKSGFGASRANLRAKLVVERITGIPTEDYQNAAMHRGRELEPQARAAYEWTCDATVETIGLTRHPSIAHTHASPDGRVGNKGLIEIKCPGAAAHLATLMGEPIADRYIKQCLWQMACDPAREWNDWCSYNPDFPEPMRLFVRRIPRDNSAIVEIEREVRAFLAEVDDAVRNLKGRYSLKREAA